MHGHDSTSLTDSIATAATTAADSTAHRDAAGVGASGAAGKASDAMPPPAARTARRDGGLPEHVKKALLQKVRLWTVWHPFPRPLCLSAAAKTMHIWLMWLLVLVAGTSEAALLETPHMHLLSPCSPASSFFER